MVHEWILNHGIRYFDIMTHALLLSEEVGYVSRMIDRNYGEQSKKEKNESHNFGEKLYDVLFVIVCLSNQTVIDLEKFLNRKLEKKKQDHIRHHRNKKLL